MTEIADLLRAEQAYRLKLQALERARKEATFYVNIVEKLANECQRLEFVIHEMKANKMSCGE